MGRCFSHRLILLPLFLLLLLVPRPNHATNGTCPYDILPASRMIPPACYANSTSTSQSVTSCCWFVFASYIYAVSRYANLTGAAFLPEPTASICSSAFSASLINRGLVRPSLLLSNNSCNLDGDPVRLAAGNRPCQYSTVSAVRSAVDLSSATSLCTSPRLDLYSNQNACVSCQNAVIAATFALFDATNSKEFVPCGMAATIGIWSSSSPSVQRFRSYSLCMLQILENIGNLGSSNLVPSPPSKIPTGSQQRPTGKTSRSVKIAAGSASAGVFSLAAIVCLILAILKRRRSTIDAEEDRDPLRPIGSPLPTEGLYVFTEVELKQASNSYDGR